MTCLLRTAAAALALAAWSGALLAQMPASVPVGVTSARTADVRATVSLTGTVESRTSGVVASEVAGLVVDLVVRAGDSVARGRPLVRLRTETLELDLKAARARLAESEARLRLADRSLERFEELSISGVVSRQELDDAASESDAWRSRVEQSQAEIARLEDDLERSVIRAPFSGVVVAEHCQVGEWVAVGGAVVEMVDLSVLEVVVNIPESHVGGVERGAKARIELSARPNAALEGVIAALVPRADPQARTFPVKVRFDNTDGNAAVGMLASVALPTGDARAATVVPKDAVVTEGSNRFVYVVEPAPRPVEGSDGSPEGAEAVRKVPVRLGGGVGDWVEVSGLDPGTTVVTRGNERLFPGVEVTTRTIDYPLP